MSQPYQPTILLHHHLHRCQNCQELWRTDQLYREIPHLFERVVAGEPMPSGECPNCHALCHPIPTTKEDHA